MDVKPDYGINVNREGDFVGLWFRPGVIERDENDYWFVSSDELRRLAAEADSQGHDALQHDDCPSCGTSWGS